MALRRLHLDGKECFSFGLNKSWQAKVEADFLESGACDSITRASALQGQESAELQIEYRKRKAFYENADWDGLEELLVPLP